MDSTDCILVCVWTFIIFIAASMIWCPVGYYNGVAQQQKLAIEANVAAWHIDAKTGKTEFRFHSPSNEK